MNYHPTQSVKAEYITIPNPTPVRLQHQVLSAIGSSPNNCNLRRAAAAPTPTAVLSMSGGSPHL